MSALRPSIVEDQNVNKDKGDEAANETSELQTDIFESLASILRRIECTIGNYDKPIEHQMHWWYAVAAISDRP